MPDAWTNALRHGIEHGWIERVLVFNSLMLLILIHSSSLPTYPPCQSRSAATAPLQVHLEGGSSVRFVCLLVSYLFLYYTAPGIPFFQTWNMGEQDRALSFFLSLLIAGWALLVHQTVRFTIVGRLSWGHRCNTWRIGMPKLSRPPNVTFYNSWAL